MVSSTSRRTLNDTSKKKLQLFVHPIKLVDGQALLLSDSVKEDEMDSRWNSENQVIDLTSDDDVVEVGSKNLPSSKTQGAHHSPVSRAHTTERFPTSTPTPERRPFVNIRGWTPPAWLSANQPLSRSRAISPQSSHSRGKTATPSRVSPFVKDTKTVPDRLLKQQADERDNARRLEIRNKRRCTECIATGLECDGEKPCSRCCEPGFDCRYPGEDGNDFASNLILSGIHKRSMAPLPEPPKTLPSITDVRMPDDLQISVQDQDSEPSRKDLSVSSSPTPSFSSTTEIDDYSEPDLMHQNSWIPQTLNEVKELIKDHENSLNLHREYLVQVETLRSKFSGQRSTRTSHPCWKENPWKKFLVPRKSSPALLIPHPHNITFQIKTLRGGGPKRFNQVVVEAGTLTIDPQVPILPKYRSIGRLGPSFLSRNFHTLKFMPYYPDDEGPDPTESATKEAELKDAYRTPDIEFYKQRRCLDVVFRWSGRFQSLMKELRLDASDLAEWLNQNIVGKCGTCEMTFRESRVAQTMNDSSHLAPADAQRCQWLYQAFKGAANVGIWHFLEAKPGTTKPSGQTQHTDVLNEGMCSICSVYNCLLHGAYEEGDENDESHALINDPEDENNSRRMLVTLAKPDNGHHICGLYCIPELFRKHVGPQEIYGVDHEGIFKGLKNDDVAMIRDAPPLGRTTTCSLQCFLSLQVRREHMGQIRKLDIQQLTPIEQRICNLAKVYNNNVRLPCIIARTLGSEMSCLKAFEILLNVHHIMPHLEVVPDVSDAIEFQQGRKISRMIGGYDTSRSAIIDKRQPFVPCSHTGPCVGNSECSCAHEKVHCEWSCGCTGDCKRRFKGCRCKGPCFNDDRCECWRNSRECDPWLCGNCGVVDVLDPSNKYREEIRESRCRNNRIQLALPARTIKARSEVQGWGLFAGENLDAFAFVGEYKGEIVQNKEASRRGVVYHYNQQEYLFTINNSQEIDGSNFGNKTRFMNNSQRDENINVLAKTLLCNGVQRVMFYTKRAVKAGEELLYNYNYPEWVHKEFWEKGEKLVGKNGMITPLAKPKISGRFTRTAIGKHDGEETPARKHEQAMVRKKRKRAVEDEDEENLEDEIRDLAMEEALGKLRVNNPVEPEEDGSGSEYAHEDEDEEHVSSPTDEAETEESELEAGFEDHDEQIAAERRQRRINPGDGRRGGNAQRKAWATRKASSMTGKFTRR